MITHTLKNVNRETENFFLVLKDAKTGVSLYPRGALTRLRLFDNRDVDVEAANLGVLTLEVCAVDAPPCKFLLTEENEKSFSEFTGLKIDRAKELKE